MRTSFKIGGISIVMVALVALACGDDPEAGTGGSGPGPAGPGVGPGPTSTGTGMGPSTTATGLGGEGGQGGTGPVLCDPDATHAELIDGPTTAENVDKMEQVGIWNEGDPLPPLP